MAAVAVAVAEVSPALINLSDHVRPNIATIVFRTRPTSTTGQIQVHWSLWTGWQINHLKTQQIMRKARVLEHIVDMKAALTKDTEVIDRASDGLAPRSAGLVSVSLPGSQQVPSTGCHRIANEAPPRDSPSPSRYASRVWWSDRSLILRYNTAHNRACTASHVLHREISLNRTMRLRWGNEIFGVLCDWDLAEHHSNGGHGAVDVVRRM